MELASVTIAACESNQAIKIIKLSGRIDTTTADNISAEVLQAVEESPGGVIFNLDDVNFVSSAGIRLFISAYKKGSAKNIKMAMIHVQPGVYKIFKMTGLESTFKTYGDESQALKEVWV